VTRGLRFVAFLLAAGFGAAGSASAQPVTSPERAPAPGPGPARAAAGQQALRLTDSGYFAARGVNVLVFSNWYSGLFDDSKLSGVELIHHGVRTATNGDVRLSNTPEQWDPIPRLVTRSVDTAAQRIEVALTYPALGFSYQIEARADGPGVRVAVRLDTPLPAALAGRAGFNLEFLPSAYFGRAYAMDGRAGLLPRVEAGGMERDTVPGSGVSPGVEAAPLARGATLVLAPEDPPRRVTIEALDGTLALYDGRTKAQNGWFVVRGLLPAGRSGTVLEWRITPHQVPGWIRPPVIAHSQVGYDPRQAKVAVLESDPNDSSATTATLLEIAPDGTRTARLSKPAAPWGRYLRYEYARFDFSDVRAPGLYEIRYRGVTSEPFRIADDVYGPAVWTPSLDTYLPEQMDHVLVREQYRVWHGASHLDDARQAPPGHRHFDLYAQGPTTDSPYRAGEHIPGLDVGGWTDAGDFDIRTESQYAVVETLAQAWEDFHPAWDETTVRERERYVAIRRPDGVPDVLQQIAHGALQLLAQIRAVGHAIPGIIAPTLEQYTFLGDAGSKTDGLVYDSTLGPLERRGGYSGVPDDRWAFTSRSSSLDYGTAAALAAASGALRGTDDSLADECLSAAVRVWRDEHARPPDTVRVGNTMGGRLADEETRAAVELLLATRGGHQYADRLRALWPHVDSAFAFLGAAAARALPYMDADYRARVEAATRRWLARLDSAVARNPFGVPITTGGWGGSGIVLSVAMQAYVLHRAFPAIVGPEYTVRGLDYVLGTHPVSSISLVSGVGAYSKTVAYGHNRADASFVAGGVAPGIVIVRPDFPELKEDWPFLWFENEYVIGEAALLVYVGNAVHILFQ
jgi:endoglucanase